jgi:hypothetical protein
MHNLITVFFLASANEIAVWRVGGYISGWSCSRWCCARKHKARNGKVNGGEIFLCQDGSHQFFRPTGLPTDRPTGWPPEPSAACSDACICSKDIGWTWVVCVDDRSRCPKNMYLLRKLPLHFHDSLWLVMLRSIQMADFVSDTISNTLSYRSVGWPGDNGV